MGWRQPPKITVNDGVERRARCEHQSAVSNGGSSFLRAAVSRCCPASATSHNSQPKQVNHPLNSTGCGVCPSCLLRRRRLPHPRAAVCLARSTRSPRSTFTRRRTSSSDLTSVYPSLTSILHPQCSTHPPSYILQNPSSTLSASASVVCPTVPLPRPCLCPVSIVGVLPPFSVSFPLGHRMSQATSREPSTPPEMGLRT